MNIICHSDMELMGLYHQPEQSQHLMLHSESICQETLHEYFQDRVKRKELSTLLEALKTLLNIDFPRVLTICASNKNVKIFIVKILQL